MCRKTLAVLLIILFVPIFIVTIIGWSLKSTILNPSYLSHQLEKNNIYGELISSAPKFLLQTLSQEGGATIPLTEQDITSAIKESISNNWLKINSELVINQVLNYINGKSNLIQASIDLRQIKSGLDKFQTTYLKAQISALPECSGSSQSSSGNLSCRPKNTSVDQLLETMNGDPNSKQESLSKNIPDTWEIGSILMPENKPSTLTQIRQFVSYFNLGWSIIAISSIILLILIGLLIFKPLTSLLRWLATTLIIPGLLLLSSAAANLVISTFIKGSTWNLPADLSNLANKILMSLLSGFANNILYISIGLIIIAIIFYVLAAIIKPKQVTNINKVAEVKNV